MNILVSVNDNYLMPLMVMLTSLFENNSDEISVWFLSSSTSDEVINTVGNYVNKRGQFHRLEVNGEMLDAIQTSSHISKEANYRLLAAEVLPKEMNRILWLDADMIILKDLHDLYNLPLEDNFIAACRHNTDVSSCMVSHSRSMGIEPKNYINSGVMLINLVQWRKLDMRGKISEIVRSGLSLKFVDQDIANIVFGGKILYADERYNSLIRWNSSRDELERMCTSSAIIHYVGALKPWILNDTNLNEVWFEYYLKSPYGGKKLHRIPARFLSRMVAGKAIQENEIEI